MLSGHFSQDLKHHQPVVTRTQHSVVSVEDTCGTVMRHFYTPQPESYQGNNSGEPDPAFTHSNNEHNLPEISMEAEWGTRIPTMTWQ